MRFLSRAGLLSLFLVFLFVVSALFGASKVSNASERGTLDVSNTLNPVTPTVLNGFKPGSGLPPSLPIIVNIAIPLNNLSLLQSMVTQISNPNSPEYRSFLSQSEIHQLFLPTSKFESTLSYLKANGFDVLSTAEDSMIVAAGTVSDVKASLGLATTLYTNGTMSYYSAAGTPTLPGVYVYASNVTSLVVAHHSYVNSEGRLGAQINSPNVTAPIEGYNAANLRSVYNASSLVASGYDGKGQNIGVFEFYGDTYIAEELQQYDLEEGLPNPPSFNIVTVGPYNPNLGVELGAAPEVSLDTEVSHAMAPGANITMYVGNGALPWSPIIATVDQQDVVNVLTQSWFDPEIYYPYEGPSFLLFNTILTDQYFMIGSLEGITFTAASGDRGGTGVGGQPAGSQGYPATSPYVVSVGGTQTYLTFNGADVAAWYQTAWSNEGFEPTTANYGGGTGGVSNLEPRPWYQNNISTPATYPNGRLGPDLALNAALWPGIFTVVDARTIGVNSVGYIKIIIGGTSEASPLLAGLITVLDQKVGGRVGLLNPAFYEMGENPSLYTKDFTPITFGYSTPWTSSNGYNLETGWGAPNIGAMAQFFSSAKPSSSPTVVVSLEGKPALGLAGPEYQFDEFVSGQTIVVNATISGSIPTDSFTAELVTLQGTMAKVPLSYGGEESWKGKIIVPATASGLSYVNVNGSVNDVAVYGFTELFTGYLATVESPIALPGLLPWSPILGFNITTAITNLNGVPITWGKYSFTNYLYSISTNQYNTLGNQTLYYSHSLAAWSTQIIPYPETGPMAIFMTGGAYGFISFIGGVSLTPFFIYPPNNAEPGAVSPGQSLEIEGTIQAPVNTPNIISAESGEPLPETIDIGSNLTASLVSSSGQTVSTAVIGGTSTNSYLGFLDVPSTATAGLYDIMLSSVYGSIDLGINVNGSYFGQVYVSGQPALVPKITLSPNPVTEGGTLTITANIAYANGTEVKYGVFSAALYPAYDSDSYSTYSALPAGQIPLWYNPGENAWVGTVVMPSPTSLGWIGGLTPYDNYLSGVVTAPVSGLWDAFVSGISSDGVPTTTAISDQQSFTVSPATPMSTMTTTSPARSATPQTAPASAPMSPPPSSSTPSAVPPSSSSQNTAPSSTASSHSEGMGNYGGLSLVTGAIAAVVLSTTFVARKRHIATKNKYKVAD